MSNTTFQPVRLAPAVIAYITTANQTITNCGPFQISGHFIKSSLGINDWPEFLYFSYYKYLQPDGYGYTPSSPCTDQQTIVIKLEKTSHGAHYYSGVISDPKCEGTIPFTVKWSGTNWEVLGITADDSPFILIGGTETNPLLAQGQAAAVHNFVTTWTTVQILLAVPIYEGYGYSHGQFQYKHGLDGYDVGYGVLPAPNTIGGIQYNDGDIAQSQTYTDGEITEVEIEIVSKNGVQYLPTTQYNVQTGYFIFYFTPQWNDVYTFRVRGFSVHNYSTSFGNVFQLVVDVPPSTITNVVTSRKLVPNYGALLTFIQSTATFYYQITPNCYGTQNVQYSLDSSVWQTLTDTSGQFELQYLPQGLHTMAVRTESTDGQISDPDTIQFFVSLSTFVTIDCYPIDSICSPLGRTPISLSNPGSSSQNAVFDGYGYSTDPNLVLIAGTREAGDTLVFSGIVTNSVVLPTPTSWQALIYLLGTETQIISVTATNFAGQVATATQAIYSEVRPPNITVQALPPILYVNKAIIQGTKDANTSVSLSHNNGGWTTVIPTNELTNYSYIIELVSGDNVISVMATDSQCNFDSAVTSVDTVYASASLVSGGFTINNGDNYTTTPLVLLTFASTTATKIKISNFPDFREGFVTPYAEQVNWFLLEFPGISQVYVQFVNDSALSSIVYTDSILLTASQQFTDTVTVDHTVISLDAENLWTGDLIGTVVYITNLHNGVYEIELFENATTALAGAPILATATTNTFGKQTLILVDAGSGLVNVSGTITLVITKDAPDIYLDHRTDVFNPSTGESRVPLQYSVIQDANFFYATIQLPYYESKFIGQVQRLLQTTSSTSVIDIDKTFHLIHSPVDGYGYGYGYGYQHFAQAICSTTLAQSFATYPLDGSRVWYPTLPIYANVLQVEQFDTFYRLTIDQPILNFDPDFACRLEFTRQNKTYTDYRIRKTDGLVEFINESTYATGNAQFNYIYNRKNRGSPDTNWYKLCGLKFNDLVTISIPQTQNKITFAQLNQLIVRFYNGMQGTAPAIVRFIVNDSIVFEDHNAEVIEGTPGYGYQYGYRSSGYGFKTGKTDQVVEFIVDNAISNDTVIQSLAIEFRATSPCMYVGEVQIMATAIPVNTNCRITVNGDTVFDHTDQVTSVFDGYEIRLEQGEADIWYNNTFVQNISLPQFDPTNVTTILGVGARTSPDTVQGSFQQADNKKYYDTPEIQVGLIGRYIAIETNLRQE